MLFSNLSSRGLLPRIVPKVSYHTGDFIIWPQFLDLVQENVDTGFAWSISDGSSGGVYIPATDLLQPLSVEEKAMVVAELCFVFEFFVGVDLGQHEGDEA